MRPGKGLDGDSWLTRLKTQGGAGGVQESFGTSLHPVNQGLTRYPSLSEVTHSRDLNPHRSGGEERLPAQFANEKVRSLEKKHY